MLHEDQAMLEFCWKELPRMLSLSLRGWSFNLVVMALQQMKNRGVFGSFELDGEEGFLEACCTPFRGYPQKLKIDLTSRSVTRVNSL
jgi:hypothetical protein